MWALRHEVHSVQLEKIAGQIDGVFIDPSVLLSLKDLSPVLLGNDEPSRQPAGLRIAKRILVVSVPADGERRLVFPPPDSQ